MSQIWNYHIEGFGKDDKPWLVMGDVECGWHEVFERLMVSTFAALTEGKAVYGEPGPCGGPYKITKLHIELVE